MRVPVIDSTGRAAMPCTPAKARHLLKSSKARPKWNKLGLFCVQLTYSLEPNNQPLVVGIDPGSKFEGFSVVATEDTVVNLMVEAPPHVKDAVETRRTMRRARRGLKRGTLVKHPKYGLCSVGGFDRKKQTISLNAYRSNKRLTQGAKVKDGRVLTWVAFRSFLVSENKPVKSKGSHPTQAASKGTPASSPCVQAQASPQALVI